MTQEEYDSLTPYKELMRTIIINSSASHLPVEYRELVVKYNKSRGYSICNCSSGLYMGTSRLYKEYIGYETKEEKPKPTKSNTKTNKRK